MKRINTSLVIIATAVVSMFFSSCSSVQNDFTRAKYYNFGHHDPVVAFTKPVHPSQEVKTTVASPEQVKIENKSVLAEENVSIPSSPKQILAARKKAARHLAQKMVSVISTATFKNAENNKAIIPVSPDEIQSSTSTEGTHSIPLIVLIILAILIPPLAVYLHDDLIKGHFWWILILWLVGGGLAFGPASYFGLLCLIAIIWAIIIVTGSAGSI